MKFQKGQSGNPGGRPKEQFGAYVREKSKGGKILVDLAWKIMTNPKSSDRDKLSAIEFLADRGFGKAPLTNIHQNPDGSNLNIMLVNYGHNNPV